MPQKKLPQTKAVESTKPKQVALTHKDVLEKVMAAHTSKHHQYPMTLHWLGDLKEPVRVSTGIDGLDAILGGGLPMGGIVEIRGKGGSGKTSLALSIASQISPVLYIDAEHKLTPNKAGTFALWGEVIIMQPSYLEEAMYLASTFIEAGVQLVVLDSLPALPMKKELDEKDWEKVAGMAMTAGYLSKKLGKINTICYDNDAMFLVVNQLRANMNVMNQWAEQDHSYGGQALQNASRVQLTLARSKWEKTPDIGTYGAFTGIKVNKSSVSRPQQSTEIYLTDYGFKTKAELAEVRTAIRELMDTGQYTPYIVDSTIEEDQTPIASGSEVVESILEEQDDD